jgi:peptidoglycan/xylan/chitin deacetylase (PgdA/CDA1 family)
MNQSRLKIIGICGLAAWLAFACRPSESASSTSPDESAASADAVEEVIPATGTPVVEPGEALVAATATEPPVPPAEAPALKINKSAQVAILGYHDFTNGKSTNPMVIPVPRFREHLQALRDAKLPVISMADFLAWRRGEKDLPPKSIMITIDDGWKSVYQLAFPVLKEYNYPFTVFLYKNFVNGGGRSMTTAEISEMMAAGATVGDHSVSHPFPSDFKRRAKASEEEYEAFVTREFTESRAFLENLFRVPVTTFAYPGGYFTSDMAQRGTVEWRYEALFTCHPSRTTWNTPAGEIGRFIIYGNDPQDRNFRAATNFHGSSNEALGRQLLGGQMGDDGTPQAPLVLVSPAENETVTQRRPMIRVDLAKLTEIIPESVSMRVAGFGTVPAIYDPETKSIRYEPVQRFRTPEVNVSVRLRRVGETKDDVISWQFFINQAATYLE